MSLQTVIELGKTIRQSDKALAYHRYVRKAPFGDKKRIFRYFQLDVNDKFEIDLNSRKEIEEEDFISEKLFYLAYRTGEADTYVKYIFGDFCSDYFKFADDKKNASSLYAQHSLDRGKVNAAEMSSPIIDSFRNSLAAIIDELLLFLEPIEHWYIHFNFQGKQWYELTETYELLNEAILSNFIKEVDGNISLDAFLVRTLIGASSRLPDFKSENTFKTKQFSSIEEVKDLLFGLDFYLKGYKIREDDIMINMLPKGNISAADIITFFEKKKQLEFENEEEATDSFLAPALDHTIQNIEKYDIIFSKESKPIGLDLLEINDVDKNLLKKTQDRIIETKKLMKAQGFNINYLGIKYSLKSLFESKKYKNHLLRVLPKIYQDTYYQDALLLPTFLQKAEYLTRNPQKASKKGNDKNGRYPYWNLRKHFFFLIHLQKQNNLMSIFKSRSYKIGLALGKMANPFAAYREDCPIKSFEKNNVGLLSRKITTIDNLVKFANQLNEKLRLHRETNAVKGKKGNKEPYLIKSYKSLLENLKELELSKSEKYNKDYCELGFFETYYGALMLDLPEDSDDNSEKEN